MTDRMKATLQEWLAQNILTLITVCVLLGGWIANYAVLGSRIAVVEEKQVLIDQRFKDDVVPRREHEARNAAIDQQLSQIQKTLDEVRKDQIQRRER